MRKAFFLAIMGNIRNPGPKLIRPLEPEPGLLL
jgi:hypothetical protein